MANKENLKPFKKGTSGNPGGRPKTKFITDWLKHPDREKDMVKMLKKTMKLAISGNMRAVEYITDRTEGKAKSYLDMAIESNPNKDEPIKVFNFEGIDFNQKIEEKSPKDDSQPRQTDKPKASTR
jgi:hypothetical protein